ncbi:MAG: creatininase family protein [Deltaproteobacteria bacterium]|nr:creatininase family protein [Deltaproteobacteria bacterium]
MKDRESIEMKLDSLANEEARAHFARGAPVYILVNPLEYHGPHLPIDTDAAIALGLARELHASLGDAHGGAPLIWGDEIGMGVEPTPGKGTVACPHRDVTRAVIAACRSAASKGARRIVLMTFHGHPLHNDALWAGVRWCRAEGIAAAAPLNVLLREMLALSRDPAACVKRFTQLRDILSDHAERDVVLGELPRDFHAGFFETSMMLRYEPKRVDPVYRELPPCGVVTSLPGLERAARLAKWCGRDTLASELSYAAYGNGWHALDPFPGYTGRPALASVEAAAFFAGEILPLFVENVRAAFAGDRSGPRSILPWLRTMSFGGRLFKSRVRTR